MSERRGYSEIIKGASGNHDHAVRFDYTTGGFVGITAYDETNRVADRILLTFHQWKALQAFVRRSPE